MERCRVLTLLATHAPTVPQDAREARTEVSRLQARLRAVEAEKAEAASHLTQARALNDALQGQVGLGLKESCALVAGCPAGGCMVGGERHAAGPGGFGQLAAATCGSANLLVVSLSPPMPS